MAAGKLLTQMDIEPIPLVSASDRVRVTLKNGGVQIQGDATARSSGARGDVVRLEMDGSKKLVQGTVTGPGRAAIDVKG
jgi:flagella basal body P-ring formation protein FlgA